MEDEPENRKPLAPSSEAANSLSAWASKYLDMQVLGGRWRGSKALKNSIFEKRHKWVAKHNNDGTLYLTLACGRTWEMHAPNVTHTSRGMRKKVKKHQKSNESDEPLIIACDSATKFSPFVIDRVIHCWLTGDIKIGELKLLEHPKTRPDDEMHFDASDTLATTDALMSIYQFGIEWEDPLIENATLAKLRHHLLSDKLKLPELLGAAKACYVKFTLNFKELQMVTSLKSIILAAMFRYSAELSTAYEGDLKVLFAQFPNLAVDMQKTSVYFHTVFILENEKKPQVQIKKRKVDTKLVGDMERKKMKKEQGDGSDSEKEAEGDSESYDTGDETEP